MASTPPFCNDELYQLINPFNSPFKKKHTPNHKKKKVIILAGPTGIGKTQISLDIARVIAGEIVSADSVQVYRGMDIGTAKIQSQDRGYIRHHLIDSRDIDESFNAVDFFNEAQQALREIFARDHVPIVVGGTGFYIHSLIYGPPSGPVSVAEVRLKIEKEMDEKGSFELYERLKSLDPDYAKTISARDRHKIIRGLEIISLTHQTVSSFKKFIQPTQEYDFRCWFLYCPKDILYKQLDARCERMLEAGFLEEVKRLVDQGLKENSSASQAIGYRQCLKFLASRQAPDDWISFIKEFKQATRRYAKRQFTWFRKEPLFRWINIDKKSIDHIVEIIIQDYEYH